jgi:lipopolysaccharide biosynthesis protein
VNPVERLIQKLGPRTFSIFRMVPRKIRRSFLAWALGKSSSTSAFEAFEEDISKSADLEKDLRNSKILIPNHVDYNRLQFPQAWNSSLDKWNGVKRGSEVCVLLHVYFVDLLPEILEYLNKLKMPFDVIITNSSGEDLQQICQSMLQTNFLILDSENKGRDILPMVHVINSGLLDDYVYVLKIHTKKSVWRTPDHPLGGTAESWRQNFYKDLIGQAGEMGENSLEVLESHKDIGIISSPGSILNWWYWGENELNVNQLLKRFEFKLENSQDLLFPAGSMYWCRAFILNNLKGLHLTAEEFEPECGQVDGTTAHAIERIVGVFASLAGYRQIDHSSDEFKVDLGVKNFPTKSPKLIANFLPQFHPTAENDLNWGLNYTEWTGLVKAKPNYPGHHQPDLPIDVGFYDLRIEQNMIDQEEMASKFGVDAFMYYYYDFNGKVSLDIPLKLKQSRKTGIDFALIWANESWTRKWDGGENEIIFEQLYPEDWQIQFFEKLLPIFKHSKYLKDELGKPIFSIYRPNLVPNLKEAITYWRQTAELSGLPGLTIFGAVSQDSFGGFTNLDLAKEFGLDGLHEFPPHSKKFEPTVSPTGDSNLNFSGGLFDYEKMVIDVIETNHKETGYHPGVMTRFDNTPRINEKASITVKTNPLIFHRWLNWAVDNAVEANPKNPMVFINAWNEWGEGAVLEPTQRYRYLYLEAVRECLRRYNRFR